MTQFGVSVSPTMLNIDLKLRATPGVVAGPKQVPQKVQNAGWRLNGGLLLPTKSLEGGFTVLAPKNFDPSDFVGQLCRAAVKYELKLPKPTFQVMDFTSYQTMLPIFEQLKAKKTRFVLVFDYQISKSHHNLKLLEVGFYSS